MPKPNKLKPSKTQQELDAERRKYGVINPKTNQPDKSYYIDNAGRIRKVQK